MLLPGHIAAPYLLSRVFRWIDFRFALAGAVFPDLLDKPLAWIFHLTPHGRWIGHSLTGLAATTLIVWLIFRRRAPLAVVSWLAGYGVHLILDAGNFMPWFFPWVSYEWPKYTGFRWQYFPITSTAEIILSIIAAVWLIISWRRHSRPMN
ncbi:MAG: metal-dependent hydrolase [Proteobacteria bacterium]|nr:metal-dependent hydrolase [Pseudomonadota bacterium]